MFPMTITLHDKSQLIAVMNALAMGTFSPSDQAFPGTDDKRTIADVDKQIKEANAGNAALAEKLATSPSTAPAAAAQETKAANSDATPEYTMELAKKLTTDMVKLKGRDAAVSVLTEFKVPVAAKLSADQIEPFCKAAQKVLAS